MRLSKTQTSILLSSAGLPVWLIAGLFFTTGVCAQQARESTESKSAQNITMKSTADGRRQGDSKVRGRVIYEVSGHPLRRAEVTLYNAEGNGQLRTELTDRHGDFVFENVFAGRYFVIANALGIVSPGNIVWRSGSIPSAITSGELKDGFSEIIVDGKSTVATEVRVFRGGVITGRVTTEDGEPVPKADIKLFQRKSGRLVHFESTWQLSGRDQSSLQTDSRGVYRIAGLPAGEYVIRASESAIGTNGAEASEGAYGDGSLVIAYYPSATTLKDARAVSVLEENESTGIDISMPARETHKIAGTVTIGPAGDLTGSVEIKIDRTDEGLQSRSPLDVRGHSDQDGKWEVDGIPDGEYLVTVGAFFGVRVGSVEAGRWVNVAPTRFIVKVGGADVSGLEIHLPLGASVSGKVTLEGSTSIRFDALRLELVNAHGKENAPLSESAPKPTTVFSRSEQRSGREDEEAVVSAFVRGEGGKFEMDRIPPGNYYLRAKGIVGEPFYVKTVTFKGVDLMRSAFKIDEGMNLAGIQVTLAGDLATVEGRVIGRTANGKPASSNTVVVLIPADEPGRRFIDGQIMTHADGFGRFSCRIPPGEYQIGAFAGRYTDTMGSNEGYPNKERSKFLRISVRPGEHPTKLELRVINDYSIAEPEYPFWM